MSVKPIGKKVILSLLIFCMILGAVGCGDKSTEGNSISDGGITAKAAYKNILQDIVYEYGVIDDSSTMEYGEDMSDHSPSGLYDAATADLNYDGRDELFAAYLIDGSLYLEIYEFDGKETKKVWDMPDIGLAWVMLNEVHGKYYWYVGITKHFNSTYSYYNGKYISSDELGDWSADERQYIEDNNNSISEEGETYRYLAHKRFGIDEVSYDEVNHLIDFNFIWGITSNELDKLSNDWDLDIPKPKVTPLEALGRIKYYGDPSKCRMTKQMALAYQEVINDIIEDNEDEDLYTMAILVDVNEDGMPLLMTGETMYSYDAGLEYQDMKVWTWDGHEADDYDFEGNVGEYSYDGLLSLSIYDGPGNGTIVTTDSSFSDPTKSYYRVSNGRISFDHTYANPKIHISEGEDIGYSPFKYGIDVPWTEHGYEFTVEQLVENGWVFDESAREFCAVFINSEQVKFETFGDYRFYQERTNNGSGYRDSEWNLTRYSTEGPVMVSANWSHGEDVAEALGLYAEVGKAEKMKLDIEPINFSDGLKYLKGILGKLKGNIPDDATNTEISNYISKYTSKKSETKVTSKKNNISLSANSISASVKAAIEAQKDMLELCREYDITLGKEPICSARIVCSDLGKGVRRLTFTNDIISAIDGCDEIRIILGDDRSCVVLDTEDIKTICNKYSSWTIEIEEKNDIEYKIAFKDDKGKQIDKLDANVGFSVPGGGDLYTIERTSGDESMNWGGQPNNELGSTEFDTAYSGTYTIVKKDVEINDIGKLSDEEQEMIEFIVARDIMSVKDGSFNPDEETSRYEFAKAFVQIFYNYDDSKPCSFSDVPKDSEYYGYVASGEELKVIEGYPDGTFKGDNTVTMEEAIAFCARILADYKDYNYPENPEEYLDFDDRADILWAVEEIALAVREGLVDKGGMLNPQSHIDRKESAELLYKLYMLLHDSEATVAGDMMGSINKNKTLVIVLISLAIVLVLAILVLAVILMKKNKKSAPKMQTEEEENETDEVSEKTE